MSESFDFIHHSLKVLPQGQIDNKPALVLLSLGGSKYEVES